ncbi:hypothetical protein LguiA_032939 [Lonicera macranthoides]
MDSTTNGNHSPPPAASCTPIWKYDVFLSYRREDTSKTITDHLYDALTRAKIRTCRDDNYQVQRGREFSFELLKAIEESRISIVIFLENYASSRWCLNELVKILECMKTRGQLVLPLFYNVDPSDVRKRKRSFGEAFMEHEGFSGDGFEDQVQRWRRELTETANLSGWDLRTDADGYLCPLLFLITCLSYRCSCFYLFLAFGPWLFILSRILLKENKVIY